MIRTRIAPSPTGYPHIGTVYQALFDFAFAKKNDGKFVVRIEDTDKERFVADAEEKLFAAFDWFDISEDESPRKGGDFGPYRQSERLDIYQKYAEELLEKGKAYYCFCTRERLDEMRKNQQLEKKLVMYDKHCRNILPAEAKKKTENGETSVIRLKIPENKKLTYKDEIRGEITVESASIDDQVILKSDGFPTYHLAVVVDDHLMEITHVVRGPEWLSSTPKHFLLYEYFDWEKPLFYHTPLLSNPDHSKLSKRHGHTNVSWYKEEGYLPEAIINFLSLLGWSHPEEKEIFTLEEFLSVFELKDIKPVAPVFDLVKLNWMNQKYIQEMPDEKLLSHLKKFYGDKFDSKMINSLLPLVKTRMTTLKDFESLTSHFFTEPEIEIKEGEKKTIESLFNDLENINDWDSEGVLNVFRKIMAKDSIRMPVLYRLLTGNEKGLPLPESLVILGKEKTLARLKKLLSYA